MDELRLKYQTIEFEKIDIHVRSLKDRLQFADKGGKAEKLGISSASWPLFGVVWPSGEVLAHYMSDYDIEGKKILEIGCGIGLSSLMLSRRNADITATDYHPEAESFLAENINLNKGKKIPFFRTGWADECAFKEKFDLIIGSDILYESEHSQILPEFINRHAKASCEVIIVDPGRGNHAKFSKKMVKLGFLHSQKKPLETAYLKTTFKGLILKYIRS
ncbi:MAG: class I SAM-dependent methyltransferase [Thermodesulfobacteriota bacterium]